MATATVTVRDLYGTRAASLERRLPDVVIRETTSPQGLMRTRQVEETYPGTMLPGYEVRETQYLGLGQRVVELTPSEAVTKARASIDAFTLAVFGSLTERRERSLKKIAQQVIAQIEGLAIPLEQIALVPRGLSWTAYASERDTSTLVPRKEYKIPGYNI